MFSFVKRKHKKHAEVAEIIARNTNQKTSDSEASTSSNNTENENIRTYDKEHILAVIEEQKRQIADLRFVLQSTGGGAQLIKETEKEIALQRAIIKELEKEVEYLKSANQNSDYNNNTGVIAELSKKVKEVELLANSAEGSLEKIKSLMDESEKKKKDYREEIARLSTRVQRLEDEILCKSTTPNRNAVNAYIEKISKLTQQNEELEKELLNARLESKRLKEDLQRLSVINLFNKENDRLSMLKNSYDRQLRELRIELEKAKKECEERIAAFRTLSEGHQNDEEN